MNINLHNYEEYFLLYADKELSREERMEVEKFIKQHPELEEEFDMINSAIMEPETFQLKDKSFLFKSTEAEFINKHNYEETFVLYHDGELSAEQKSLVIEFLEKNPKLNDEFLLISQARIQADPVSFPDKKSLLRKEHSGITGRIIMFRSLAAAAVLGFGLWIAAPYFSGSDPQNQVAQQRTIPDNTVQENTGAITGDEIDNRVATLEQTEGTSEIQVEKTGVKEAVASTQKKEVKNKKEEVILAKKVQDENPLQAQEKNIQQPNSEKKKKEANEVMIAQIPPMEISTGEIRNRNELAHVDIDITPKVIEKNYTAQNVVHLDVNKEPSGNYIFYNVPEEEFRKTKIGGFLKKVKRVVERNDPIRRLFEGEEGEVASNN